MGTNALEEVGLLAKVRDPGTVVVSEHLVAEDRIGDLRSVDEVHLEKTRLKRTLLGAVLLERVEEEGRRLLVHALRHKDVDDLKVNSTRSATQT